METENHSFSSTEGESKLLEILSNESLMKQLETESITEEDKNESSNDDEKNKKLVFKYFTPREVAEHNTCDDLWVSWLGYVYDLTPLALEHRGTYIYIYNIKQKKIFFSCIINYNSY